MIRLCVAHVNTISYSFRNSARNLDTVECKHLIQVSDHAFKLSSSLSVKQHDVMMINMMKEMDIMQILNCIVALVFY